MRVEFPHLFSTRACRVHRWSRSADDGAKGYFTRRNAFENVKLNEGCLLGKEGKFKVGVSNSWSCAVSAGVRTSRGRSSMILDGWLRYSKDRGNLAHQLGNSR